MVSNMRSVELRVLAASTGVCYPVSMHPNDLSVANIRRRLAGAVPPQDQILLLGPPYKVPKDSTLRSEEVLSALRLGDEEDDQTNVRLTNPPLSEESSSQQEEESSKTNKQVITLRTATRSGAKRLFLFSKQALSDSSSPPTPCTLTPTTLTLPTTPDPSPISTPPSTSPLHEALKIYERRFMLHLTRARALTDGADLRLSAVRTCVSEQAIMARALRAAVSNLADHRNGATRTRTEFTGKFQGKMKGHGELLAGLEERLGNLRDVALDRALVGVARASGRVMETLLDTVPVERERMWAGQCRVSHDRLLSLFGELDGAFGQLGTAASREEEARQDSEAEEEIEVLSAEVESTARSIRDEQAKRLDILTADHGEAVRIIMDAISTPEDGSSNTTAQSAFATLESMSNSSTNILPSMEADDLVFQQFMQKVADAKTNAMKRMRQRLRQVSLAQSAIQRVLSSVAVLRDALAQQCENMVHLEHVSELPNAYRDFLNEIKRRRAYGLAVKSTSEVMMERLAAMRADEVKARESFLRGPGRHLMPAFFEIFVPTLATPPPLFTPQLPTTVELDTLPDVAQPLDTPHTTEEGHDSTSSHPPQQLQDNDSPMESNISSQPVGVSASSLTEAQSQPEQQDKEKPADQPTHPPQPDNTNDQQSLIVSADENNDIIMETTQADDEKRAADAERKTLAYENAVLRQAIEAMGKTPTSYIQEARLKDTKEEEEEREKKRVVKDEKESEGGEKDGERLKTEIGSLREELESVKNQLQQSNQALLAAKRGDDSSQPDDRISHSSFGIGDVGLFMPTGKVKGGKRTYLAFHTNCPHRYLSTDGIEGTPGYVLGRIVYQEELVAGPVGTNSNPYSLRVGTKFWVLTVEVLKIPT